MTDTTKALVEAAIHRWRRNGLNEPATRLLVKEQYGMPIEYLDHATLRRMAGTCWNGRHACAGAKQTPLELARIEAHKRERADSSAIANW